MDAKELRKKLLSKEFMLQKTFELLGFPYSKAGYIDIGSFYVSQETEDEAEEDGFSFQQKFNQNTRFIWHPTGEQWEVSSDRMISLTVKLIPQLLGIKTIPIVWFSETKESIRLARIILKNGSKILNRGLRESIQLVEDEQIYLPLAYEKMVPGARSFRWVFRAFFAHGNEIISSIADSSASPFKGPLDPNQDDAQFLFVQTEDNLPILKIWENQFRTFYSRLQIFNERFIESVQI